MSDDFFPKCACGADANVWGENPVCWSCLDKKMRQHRADVLAGKVKWGLWSYDPELRMLHCEQYQYSISLEDRCSSSGRVLDFITQIAKKTWATSEIVGDLVRAFNALYGLQERMCGLGANHIIDVGAVLSDMDPFFSKPHRVTK